MAIIWTYSKKGKIHLTYRAKTFYFDPSKAKQFKGKQRTNLPQVLKHDLNKCYEKDIISRDHNYCYQLKLNRKQDLEEIRKIAENREEWRHLTRDIWKAGEAVTSVD